jgi:hypothetical protein
MAVNLDLIRKKRQEALDEANKKNANFYSWIEGRNILRILPPWEGSEDITRIFGKHWGLGSEGKINVFCPKQCFGEPCPICEQLSILWKRNPSEEQKEWLRRVGAAPRYYANVVDMNNPDEGPQIAELPKTVMEEIWNIMLDDEVGLGDISNPDKGYDLIIDKTGKGLSTRYTIRAKRTPSAIDKSYVDQVVNLDTFVKTESYENLRLIWEGKEPAALPAPVRPEILPPAGASFTPAATGSRTPAAPSVSALEAGTLPACFGSFNEDDARCLDCPEQDECEDKMIEERRKARAAKRTPAADRFPEAPLEAAPRPSAPAGTSERIADDALMKEMEAAIAR